MTDKLEKPASAKNIQVEEPAANNAQVQQQLSDRPKVIDQKLQFTLVKSTPIQITINRPEAVDVEESKKVISEPEHVLGSQNQSMHDASDHQKDEGEKQLSQHQIGASDEEADRHKDESNIEAQQKGAEDKSEEVSLPKDTQSDA